MADIKAKKVIFKNRDGEHLIPYVGDSVIDHRITNCLLEVPQRIKLELNNGVLTLKAGSTVIVPNGFESDGTTYKFDYVTTESDITVSGVRNRRASVILNLDKNIIDMWSDGASSSGAATPTPPGNSFIWYDTTNNIFKVTSDKGVTWTETRRSLPLGLISFDSESITSIDQVFNGMGYIGSTQWYDKDIVGLSPNGLNSDGTYNNTEIRRTRLTVRTFGTDSISYNWQLGSSAHRDYSSYYAQETQPALSGNWLWYDTLNNKLYGYSGSTGLRDMSGTFFIGGFGTRTKGVVTSFNPKQPFRAVDWYDLEASINDLEIDIDMAVPAGAIISSASSTSPAGYLLCNGSAISRTTYAKLFSAIGTTYGTGDGSTTFNLPNFTTYKFVTSTSVSVKGNGKGLGLTNGTSNYSPMTFSDKGYGLLTSTQAYNTNVGTVTESAGGTSYATVGVVTDASKSGITGTVSTATIKWYIKY